MRTQEPAGWPGAAGGRAGLALALALTLGGCSGGLGLGGASAPQTDAAPASADLDPTDVAAPEVFQVSEPGLWDGRPSLGGLWVAHPDVTDPERVRIVNTGNGRSAIGALFRRERDLPGPALQVSSDTAEALGMLAGAPAQLEVTALRRTEAPAATPAASAAAETEAAGATPAAVATAPLDAAAPEGPATAAQGADPASSLNFPYVQLGSYNVEPFAQDTANGLQAKGLPARLVQVPGQEVWRLLLGPATTESGQTELLERAAAEGFADAYLVRS
ncbi:SPOR domain-containing protein [Rubellimicrobium roseum]|nr:SPOR domain-containing protein [Rubellimicrobium roseum]